MSRGCVYRRLTERLQPTSGLLYPALLALAVGYIGWKIGQSPEQALQFTFNGLSVGAVYALLAMGFTLVYSTVWFFDLYYGAAAALGAYGVFYLGSHDVGGGQYQVNELYVNLILAVVVAGVVAWAFHAALGSRFAKPGLRRGVGVLVSAGSGVYTGFVLAYPDMLNVMLSPVVGLLTAATLLALFHVAHGRLRPGARSLSVTAPAAAMAGAVGAYCGLLVAGEPGSSLYLSWGVSCLLAGAGGLALYRGLYVRMRQRARSPLVMLVASLGVLLAITALVTIVFESTPRPLPDAFGSSPITLGGATIKGFNLFTIGVALAGFVLLLFLLKVTSFGKTVRAIGDDEEVAKVVGINTTVVIAVVFFLGAAFAALGGLLSGHDISIQPRMGLLLLLKGWVASVVGGMGNIYGALLGGFVLGLVEQFGIWDLAGEWKDAISFILLILFLSFRSKGLLPRK